MARCTDREKHPHCHWLPMLCFSFLDWYHLCNKSYTANKIHTWYKNVKQKHTWWESHMYQKQPLVQQLLYGPFKRNQADELPSGDRRPGLLFKNYTLQSAARRWHQQKRHWGSGGVEVATHPVQNQNSLGRPRRWGKTEGREEKRKTTCTRFTVYTAGLFGSSLWSQPVSKNSRHEWSP